MQGETDPREENRVREGEKRDPLRQSCIVHRKPPFATKMPVVRSETTTRSVAGKLSLLAAEHPGDDGTAPFGAAWTGGCTGPHADFGDGRSTGVDGFFDHAPLDLVANTDNSEGTGDLESPLFFLFGRHLRSRPFRNDHAGIACALPELRSPGGCEYCRVDAVGRYNRARRGSRPEAPRRVRPEAGDGGQKQHRPA